MNLYWTLIVAVILTAFGSVTFLAFRRTGISSISLEVFFRRLIRGWRTPSISPESLRSLRSRFGDQVLLIDLRPSERFDIEKIPGALSRPFDVFLKELVVDRKYDADITRPIVLVCDTGHMSRVAVDIMTRDEGFSRVYNLRGGMKAWRQSQAKSVCWCIRGFAPGN